MTSPSDLWRRLLTCTWGLSATAEAAKDPLKSARGWGGHHLTEHLQRFSKILSLINLYAESFGKQLKMTRRDFLHYHKLSAPVLLMMNVSAWLTQMSITLCKVLDNVGR